MTIEKTVKIVNYLSVADVARILDVSCGTLYHWMAVGNGPYYYRYPVEGYIEEEVYRWKGRKCNARTIFSAEELEK
jgi:predicted site-specific integrase-resolvase